MCSYNAINGTASWHSRCIFPLVIRLFVRVLIVEARAVRRNRWMNYDVVRKHWGFTGAIESDCGAVEGISSHRHGGYARSDIETAVAALNSTMDVDCMFANKNAYTNHLHDAKLVTREQIEAAVVRWLGK